MTLGYRDTWAEISLDAIEHNTRMTKAALTPSCRFMAVVKADGYGHGAAETARAALRGGADYLAVAFVDEGLQLRRAGITAPVLVLGYTPPHAVEAAVRYGLTLTVFTDDVLAEAIACTDRLAMPLPVHFKVDTGMTRIGVTSAADLVRLVRTASASRYVLAEGLFTHFACADGPDDAYTREQFAAFDACRDALRESGLHVPLHHCCNSAATLRYPELHLDMVRFGISLYGLMPSEDCREYGRYLIAAMSLRTRIVSLRRIPAGRTVSYGGTFTAQRETLIATLPAGYADGLSRRLSGRGCALLRGQRAPIAGRVCMDQTMLDVTDVPGVELGDEVTLFGLAGGSVLPVDEVAELMETIPYETVCLIGKRVPRVYTRGGRITSTWNGLL
ncbi:MULTISPECIES: alanine racemase [Paenibacillus]|uniref:alanine racemase n=1 Tax=Paenibacillus TaxID=44249 RepID=UPI0022B8FBE8|nr:alanine racemase [Paenibacillus caseinilyticus]MCZ8521766.1 alanine racemase [Paenibacillus caseinilyticus]